MIGEVKYGKPILDRVIKPEVSVGDASRCAMISMDSTLKSDLTVGPPIDFAVYRKDEYKIASQKCLNINDGDCLLYTSPSPRDLSTSRMPSSA